MTGQPVTGLLPLSFRMDSLKLTLRSNFDSALKNNRRKTLQKKKEETTIPSRSEVELSLMGYKLMDVQEASWIDGDGACC